MMLRRERLITTAHQGERFVLALPRFKQTKAGGAWFRRQDGISMRLSVAEPGSHPAACFVEDTHGLNRAPVRTVCRSQPPWATRLERSTPVNGRRERQRKEVKISANGHALYVLPLYGKALLECQLSST